MYDVTAVVTENGSYRVTGGISLVDPGGEPIAGDDGDPIFLWSCCGSTNGPLRDGAHSTVGFQGAMAAVGCADAPAR